MNENIQVNERINIGRTPDTLRAILVILLPIECFGVGIFMFYLVFHAREFIGTSATVVAWLGWILAFFAYSLLAWLAVRVIRAFLDTLLALARGVAEVHGKFIDNRNTQARKELLHTADNYVVYLNRGKITVQSVVAPPSYRIEETEDESQDELEGNTVAALPGPIQTFRELLESGVVQQAMSQGKMILGYSVSTRMLRYGSWLDLYSCGVGGVSGSGKTTTVRFLLLQAVLDHGKLIMVDPHIEEVEESLAAQFKPFKDIHQMAPCSDDPKEVAKRVTWLDKEYRRRKAKGIKGPAILFVLDEFNALIRHIPDELRKELADLLLNIAQEGRKFGLFALLIAQRWSEADLGGKNYGAAIRSSLASIMAHRMQDEDQAAKLVGRKNASRCQDLEQGHNLFRDTNGGLNEMHTPYTTSDDGLLVYRMITGETGAETSPQQSETGRFTVVSSTPGAATEPLQITRYRPETSEDDAVSEPETTDIHALARQVIALQANNTSKPDIMRQLWNVSPGASEGYKAANIEYQAVMRYIAEQLGA